MNDEVVWKEIKGYEQYLVSNTGQVMNGKTGRILKPYLTNSGYYVVSLSLGGVASQLYVHRLVAQAFIDNPLNKATVNHIDANKQNNQVNNLEWATHKENITHAKELGLCAKKLRLKPTAVYYLFAKQGMTKRQLGRELGVSEVTIGRYCNDVKYKEQRQLVDMFGILAI